MSKLQINEFIWQTLPSSPLVQSQLDSAQQKRTEKDILPYNAELKIPRNTVTFLLFYGNTDDTVYLKMWWESTVAPNPTIKSELHLSLQMTPVKCFALRIKDFCAYQCLIHSLHLFLPFILCRCVTAIVITLVIDHSSGQAPTSLPSLETTVSTCIWVNMPVIERTPLDLMGTTNPSAEACTYSFLSPPTQNEKG